MQAHAPDAPVIRELEVPLLPPDMPKIEATCILLASEDSRINGPMDIFKIIESCLKESKPLNWHNPICTIMVIKHLTAMSEYIKLRMTYKSKKVCKQPCLKVSLAIACQMGKGIYFAHQICHNKLYLLKHNHLPPHKEYVQHGQYSLLDNEAILRDVRIYLVAQSLGSICPQMLCLHVNDVILPALEIKAKISELTAKQWLKLKLGYECKEAKKGIYIDGHECPDVIKEREVFIAQINTYELYVTRDLQLQ